MSDAANSEQAVFWNELAGPAWVELNPLLDRQIGGIGARAVAALAPRPGERLLDVGCGCGGTTLGLAEAVGPEGAVIGVDISRPMLEVARQRAAEAGARNVQFVEGDAQTWRFDAGGFDGIFSRFGVMFFADPTAAFGNLRAALKPGGRLAFACWRNVAENPWMAEPMAAAASQLPPSPPADPAVPGPFAFADAGRVRRILAGAGFTQIDLVPLDTQVGGNSLAESLTLALRVGPLGARLRERPELAPQVTDAVHGTLAAHQRGGQVWMDAAAWIVTARRG